MSSPPNLFSSLDLIPGLNSPATIASPQPTPLNSPPLSTHHHRSKTAPPPNYSPSPHHLHQSKASPLETSTAVDAHEEEQTSSNESSPTSSSNHTSCLRRTPSTLSTGPTGSTNGNSREKKRLRFTSLDHSPSQYAGPSRSAAGDIIFPGRSLEEGSPIQSKGTRGIPKDQVDYLRSDPGTPNLSETADQIRRTLSLASLDSLLLISANHSGERDKLLAEVSKVGKDLVWRAQDEKKLLPRDPERAGILALKRGLRSFLLAFSVRAGVNVLLTLFRNIRNKRLKLALFRHAIFGQEPFRFGAMLGTFTFLNTLTLHILRLAPPLGYYKRRLKNGIFNKPTFGPPEREGDEGERRWQAAVAGAVGSLGLLWESQSRRTGVAQQMFVRGLQASYNQYTPRLGIHIPHGDLLVFGACCGQIMFAWLCSPETIPKEYSAWILQASRVPSFAVNANRTITRQSIIEPLQVEKAMAHQSITPRNMKVLQELMTKIKGGLHPAAVPCEMVHPWVDSCTETNLRRFFAVFRFMLPVYSALHLIPMLVLRRHHVQRDPLRMLARAIWGITRSCSFLGVFVAIYQSLFCLRIQSIEQGWGTKTLTNLLKRKESFWLMGFSTCLSLLVEEKKRRAELAMYVLPRALESAWSSARRRAWVPIVPFGETILGAVAMGMVMDAYKHQPDAMSGIVRRLLFQLVGPV
ncbi:uncharacterized protein I206_104685 [Kwoniella pini CBS 10737]|uniref:Transmembrane protein 135 N-terminal domain-containing protein n=1 Tax=Kwoniella pini CBS 10737 TaxID=1296096 RepID=A0A1B9I7R8_9TREE|nr:uncharacterized protein I206_02223 [Kwoniella pini CBS 10737]OCF51509.1 hypothetical protein I206_02223 [Kwoniella pini CBS 10737]